MASNIVRSVLQRSSRFLQISDKIMRNHGSQPIRLITTSETGAVLHRPEQVRFGLIKVAVIVTPFLLGGATISREFAAWLEEHELFVPDDDDD